MFDMQKWTELERNISIAIVGLVSQGSNLNIFGTYTVGHAVHCV